MAKRTEAEIREAVSKSLSISEVMVNLGFKQFAGGSHTCLSRRIKKLRIDTSHFLGQRKDCGERRIGGPARKKRADEILIYHADGRRAKTPRLKRALLEKGKEEKCFVCGLSSWQNKPLVLEIEHKDGDFQNDREENLDFICPNCHSQTETYCRQKRGLVAERNTHSS